MSVPLFPAVLMVGKAPYNPGILQSSPFEIVTEMLLKQYTSDITSDIPFWDPVSAALEEDVLI